VEALTFAEEVVVMTRGKAVQVGSADALFERPAHTFVGHFIGSPGMNFLPVLSSGWSLEVAGMRLTTQRTLPEGALKLGIRPEYVTLAEPSAAGAVAATVVQVQDVGTHQMLTAQAGESVIKARLPSDVEVPAAGSPVWLKVVDAHTCFYRDEELVA
jgi:glycerol transport system ATP-binding protein